MRTENLPTVPQDKTAQYEKMRELVGKIHDKLHWYQSRSEVMNDFLVFHKDFFPAHRAAISFLYRVGFVLLAIPTLEVFAKVVIQGVRSLGGLAPTS